MKNFLIVIALLLACGSCQETPQAEFEKEGISLTCPKGWKITDEENLDDEGYYLSIEKDGLNSSGLITLSWINGELDLKEWITIYRDELRNNIVYRNSNLRFVNERQDTFNTINTTSIQFTASMFGLEHQGTIHFFYENDKTFALLKQEAVEDKNENKSGFEFIEQSFKIQ